ncbi:MAG: hypothetical protein KJ607_13445, partial [Bacteroidetes bacterium]|nr:hypothetical protein [Bacteroidota bacterium]
MKIPKKITPDYLKDTIIQILYDPVCHPELVLGRFEVFVSKDFNFKGGRPSRNEMRLPDGAAMTIEQLQSGFFIHKTLPI